MDFVCLAAFLFPFYADELITMVVRLKDGESLLNPTAVIFYQILANEMGIAHWKISLGYGIVQLMIGLAVLSLRPFGLWPIFLFLAAIFIAFIRANHVIREKVLT